MLKKIKASTGDWVRGFRGLYENKKEAFWDLPISENRRVIGETEEGREIAVYHFGEGGKVKILFMGGIHGNEVGTVKLMHRLVAFLDGHPRFLGVELYVLPCLNLDGLAKAFEEPDYFGGGKVGRLNANGVDLNRNFETESFEEHNYWYFGDKYIPVYCGEKPFSEKETRALRDFIKKEGIEVLYSFHSRGKEVLGAKDDLSQNLTKDFVKNSGYRYVEDDSWVKMGQTGTIKEWCEQESISYVEVECARRWGSDWETIQNAIISGIKYHYG